MTSLTGSSDSRAALERLLGVPAMAWLVRRVRERILAAGGEPLVGVVRLQRPTAEQRDAATKLVGPPRRPGSSLRLDLAEVEEILRRGPWPAGLADAVVTLTGPVIDRDAERTSEAAAWARAVGGLAAATTQFPGLAQWWDEWCRAGNLKRAARSEAARLGTAPGAEVATRLVHEVAIVLAALPAPGVPLAVFARQTLGDAHGLDEARPLGRLARAAVAASFGSTSESLQELSVRAAWAEAGVVMSNVASTALALGVRGRVAEASGTDTSGTADAAMAVATASALEAMRAARAPVVLTLDQVRSGGVQSLPADAVVHVCENPTVVEVVASRWATRSMSNSPHVAPVLVCTSGQPSTAVAELLLTLTADGAECRYHGDFDWAGLRIARAVHARVPWVPWRFTTADYLAAAHGAESSLLLTGAPAEAPWDSGLMPAMTATGYAVEEEAVADLLAADLVGPLGGTSASRGTQIGAALW